MNRRVKKVVRRTMRRHLEKTKNLKELILVSDDLAAGILPEEEATLPMFRFDGMKNDRQ